ncbi:MAG: response regulator [Granulicella sp.]
MKRRILLVDDEVAVLLTLKAVLEISGFEVDTAASAKDARLKLKNREYAMVITDMRMEHDIAGAEVIQAAREAEYYPAVALLTAFPVAEEDWQELDTDKVEVLMKPMHTRVLLQQIEALLVKHDAKRAAARTAAPAKPTPAKKTATKAVAAKTKTPAKKAAIKKTKAR